MPRCICLYSTCFDNLATARERVKVDKLRRNRSRHGKMISSREIDAMILENSRSSDRTDRLFLTEYLMHLEYPGDSKIYDFFHQ